MAFLLPSEPGYWNAVNPAYAEEREILLRMGQRVLLVDHDALCAGDVRTALLKTGLDAITPSTLAWRGWMMPVDAYAGLEEGVSRFGHSLLDDANAYRMAHHAEKYAQALSILMPPTWFAPADDRPAIESLLTSLRNTPLVLKDQVKSEASQWLDACFIPEPENLLDSMRVVDCFITMRDQFLVSPLTFKAFLPLAGEVPGLAWEWRVFVNDGEVTAVLPRSNDVPEDLTPPPELVRHAAGLLNARWWTMDWAITEEGEWVIIEAGWGGVSSCPRKGIDTVLGATAKACQRSSSRQFLR